MIHQERFNKKLLEACEKFEKTSEKWTEEESLKWLIENKFLREKNEI